ncbi:hypothetical protein CONLIGDRAFT_92980 [Coniochaeta ligniaria NRRL 30616]|uniref:Uncharacterized protein n=1 Tax=Coniochaeta ligniaria NRRL 30616 TaxID=1408157 RepID=A0A1J7IWD1_9PEZI|nr:hypothetical protein CONLIGDRAFT_92980 [Coniochaeta ligniaria NRRL 30616]
MDDQFGGRTDDDLFADEFEPVAAGAEPPVEATQQAPPDISSHAQQETQTPWQPEVPVATPAPPVTSKPISEAPPSAPSAPRGLRQSRHAHNNTKPAPAPRPPRQQHQAPVAKTSSSAAPSSDPPTSTEASAIATASTSEEVTTTTTTDDKDDTIQPTPPTGPSAGTAAPRNGTADKPDREARLKSGANPRTKLTDTELAAKMEQMRILSAEKTRRFEQAQRDESEHAVAYARGMEEARKRRALEDERRRRGEEERRRMDDERAKNRERKLAALGQKEGGWDLGRDHEEEVEERRFKSAHGGVRGARSGAGLAGSRFASVGDDQAEGRRDFGGDRGGRGRGRGRGGRGRGGLFDDRAGEDRGQGNGYNGTSRAPAAQKPPAVDEFPALPSSGVKKSDVPAKAPLPQLDALSPLSPKVGGWDDEMAAMDAKQDG